MPRRSPGIPAPTVLPGGPARSLFELRLEVVTPMFGGGVDARRVDFERPVTAKAVRGHLRFWWRACRAHRHPDAASLFREEARIWGAPSRDEKGAPSQSPVDVTVDGFDGDFLPVTQDEDRWVVPEGKGYRPLAVPSLALHFFKRSGKPPRVVEAATGLYGVTFDLRITQRFPVTSGDPNFDVRAEVEAALWAWLTFGGVGARTRRGCGTLLAEPGAFRPPSRAPAEAAAWIADRFRSLGLQAEDPGSPDLMTPRLHAADVLVGTIVGRGRDSVLSAWSNAVNPLQYFRQGLGFARGGPVPQRDRDGNPRLNRRGEPIMVPGRSRWPEAGAIRALAQLPLGQASLNAQRDFPRVDLGLPLNFQQMGDPNPEARPIETARRRMASPVIVKALPVTNDTALPICLVLTAPHPWHPLAPDVSVFIGGPGAPLDRADAEPAALATTKPLLGQPNAREAYVEHLRTGIRFDKDGGRGRDAPAPWIVTRIGGDA